MTAILSELNDTCLFETLTSIDDVIRHDAQTLYEAVASDESGPISTVCEILQIAAYATVRRAPVLADLTRRAAQDGGADAAIALAIASTLAIRVWSFIMPR